VTTTIISRSRKRRKRRKERKSYNPSMENSFIFSIRDQQQQLIIIKERRKGIAPLPSLKGRRGKGGGGGYISGELYTLLCFYGREQPQSFHREEKKERVCSNCVRSDEERKGEGEKRKVRGQCRRSLDLFYALIKKRRGRALNTMERKKDGECMWAFRERRGGREEEG